MNTFDGTRPGIPATVAGARGKAEPERSPQTERIGFLLMPEFPVYAFILAIEALRVANQNAGERLFSSHLLTSDGKPVVAGNGMSVVPDLAIADAPFLPTVIVFACNHPEKHIKRGLLAWLRRLDRHGALIGAVDTGQFALAKAGLLDAINGDPGIDEGLGKRAVETLRAGRLDRTTTIALDVEENGRIGHIPGSHQYVAQPGRADIDFAITHQSVGIGFVGARSLDRRQ